MLSLKDRYLATLWGLHVGDAIWAPYERMTRTEVDDSIGRRGLRFHKYQNPWPKDDNGDMLPAGRPTDDSDQAADLCHSLLACNGVDQSHLRDSLQASVIHGQSRLWKGRATGAGKTTRFALSDEKKADAFLVTDASGRPFASNGSLMRSAPMALWLGPTPKGYPKPNGVEHAMVKAMSEVTHTHPDSIAACWLYVRMLRNALAERDFTDFEIEGPFDLRIGDYIVEVEKTGKLPEDPGSFKNGWGAAEYSLKVALHAVMTTTSFELCIRQVGMVGGDTDTYGAIAGGLAGARYGTKAIPWRWRRAILGKQQMKQYATEMYLAH